MDKVYVVYFKCYHDCGDGYSVHIVRVFRYEETASLYVDLQNAARRSAYSDEYFMEETELSDE